MYVLAFLERIYQHSVPGQVRQHPQLYLGVIRGQQKITFLTGDKRSPYLSALLCPYGNILQIGIAAAESPGLRHSLVERRMHPPGVRVHGHRQSVHVCGFQLSDTSILQN